MIMRSVTEASSEKIPESAEVTTTTYNKNDDPPKGSRCRVAYRCARSQGRWLGPNVLPDYHRYSGQDVSCDAVVTVSIAIFSWSGDTVEGRCGCMGMSANPGLLRWRCARYWRSANPLELTGCVWSLWKTTLAYASPQARGGTRPCRLESSAVAYLRSSTCRSLLGHDQRWYPVGQHHLVAKVYNGHILPIHRDWRLSNRLF